MTTPFERIEDELPLHAMRLSGLPFSPRQPTRSIGRTQVLCGALAGHRPGILYLREPSTRERRANVDAMGLAPDALCIAGH